MLRQLFLAVVASTTLMSPAMAADHASYLFRATPSLIEGGTGDVGGGGNTGGDNGGEVVVPISFEASVPASTSIYTGIQKVVPLAVNDANGIVTYSTVSAPPELTVLFDQIVQSVSFASATPGVYPVVLRAEDADGKSAEKVISVSVVQRPVPDIADIPTGVLRLGKVGDAVDFAPSVTAGGSAWSLAGTLFFINHDLGDYGLSFDGTTGRISGDITQYGILQGVKIEVVSPLGDSDATAPFSLYLSPSETLAFNADVAAGIVVATGEEKTVDLVFDNAITDLTLETASKAAELTLLYDSAAPSYTVLADNPGTFPFRIKASDIFGRSAFKDIDVTSVFKLSFTQISASANSFCGITAKGALYCWGSNNSGELGDGTNIDRSIPTLVQGMTGGVSKVATGMGSTCAIKDGGAYCWGNNTYGQLGIGSTVGTNTPQPVVGMGSGVTDISVTVGADYARKVGCAIKSGGAYCWGHNSYGGVGAGDRDAHNSPVQVYGLTSGVQSIQVGESGACALVNGGIKCWGNNYRNALGAGHTGDQLVPVDLAGLTSGVSSFDYGFYHGCAVVSGAVKCWGYNNQGQLGDGSTTGRASPVTVTDLPAGIVSVATDHWNSCATTAAGSLYCWGENAQGAVGDGTLANRLRPVAVSGMSSGVAQVSVGVGNICAMQSGFAKCWGKGASVPVEVAYQR